MTKFDVGDRVSVPSARLGVDAPYAMLDREVRAVERRSILLDTLGGHEAWVASAHATKQVGVRLVRLGDIDTEETLLDPIAKGLNHYFRLLLPESARRTWWVRSLAELDAFVERDASQATHVVLIAHCRRTDGHFLLANEEVSPSDLVAAFDAASPKLFLSLACSSGQMPFGRPFSNGAACRVLLAPFQAIHGAVAIETCALLFNNLMLKGRRTADAVKEVNASLPQGVHLRRWTNGSYV